MTGADLKAWRKGRRWSQRRAGLWAGVSSRTWRRYENGRVPVWLVRRIHDQADGLLGLPQEVITL